MHIASFNTPLGQMIAVADAKALLLLEFTDQKDIQHELERLEKKMGSATVQGSSRLIDSIQHELEKYFAGTLTLFKTPLHLLGTPFQISVWEELRKIPSGETRSYADIAKALGKPTAYRAVAQANGRNNHVIIVPCHRVINADGKVGGYSSGLPRKQWLLDHEAK